MGVLIAGNIAIQSSAGPLPISMGGTGQTTAPAGLNALLPVQTGQSTKVLTTDGTNASWSSGAGGTPGGSDTQIQYNDAGTFGGSSFLVVNKTTGAITSTSTLANQGLFISNIAETTRAIKLQTAGSDRWLLQANNTAEGGGNTGSNFEFVRVADNGATQNQVFTVARSTGTVDFKVSPTVNGAGIGGTPGGSDTEMQFNNGGVFAGASQVTYASGTGVLSYGGVEVGYRVLPRVTTFDAAARGKRVALSAGVTIPANTYVAGDAFSFYNDSASSVTITQGSGLTLRQDGTTNTGTRTLVAYGTCFVWFNTATEAIISGSIT